MYRALALKLMRQGFDLANEAALESIVASTQIDLAESEGRSKTLLDGIDVSDLIRTPEISQMASKVSALPVVRKRMLELQRALGRKGSIVAEGRDIGTVIFPEAAVKIFLDASVTERARRRYEELRRAGRNVTFEETTREIEERDKRDSERALAPLREAEDALRIDSSELSADAVADRVMKAIREKASGAETTKRSEPVA